MIRTSAIATVCGVLAAACFAPAWAGAGIKVTFKKGEFSREERAKIESIASAAFDEVRALLPNLEPRQRLEVRTGRRVIPQTGEVGAAEAPGQTSWTVDPSRAEGVLAIAESHLRGTLFHELHHQARGWVMRDGPRRTSFMDAVISEGMATAFERDAAESQPPWGVYPDDVDAWVAELMALPLEEGFADYRLWMFEHPDGRKWIGYRAGTYIVDRAMRHSGRSAAELVETPTREILQLARIESDD